MAVAELSLTRHCIGINRVTISRVSVPSNTCIRVSNVTRLTKYGLSIAGSLIQLICSVIELLLSDTDVRVVVAHCVVVLLLSKVGIAVNVRLLVAELLLCHCSVFAVGRNGVAKSVLGKPLYRVDIIQIILGSSVSGVARDVVYCRVRHGRIQDAALCETIQRTACVPLECRRNRLRHCVLISLWNTAALQARQRLVCGAERALISVYVFGEV